MTSQNLKYGGLHDSWFANVQTSINVLFPSRFVSNLYQIVQLEKFYPVTHINFLYCLAFFKLMFKGSV